MCQTRVQRTRGKDGTGRRTTVGGGVTKGRMRYGYRSRLAWETIGAGGVLRLTERHPRSSLDSEPAIASQRLFTIGRIFSHSRSPGPSMTPGWKQPLGSSDPLLRRPPWRLGVSVRPELVLEHTVRDSTTIAQTAEKVCGRTKNSHRSTSWHVCSGLAKTRDTIRLRCICFPRQLDLQGCCKTLRCTPGGLAIRRRRSELVLVVR